MAVRNQPVGQPTAVAKDLPQPPSGDQASTPLPQQKGEGPCGILRSRLAEMLHEGINLRVGTGDAIQLIEQGLEGLHDAG